jgi:23S rRNA pseudouridine1911/1915/1917 synthase
MQRDDRLEVLYEDNHIIAINKRNNELVQGDYTGDQPLSDRVKEYIKDKYNKPGDVYLGLPHRLDRPVSGVILFARTSKALTRLNEMFQNKDEIEKTYWAIVQKRPELEHDTITGYMLKDTEKNKSHLFQKARNGAKFASLDYTMLSRTQNFYLLQIDLHTGRHHQIRCMLSKMGCPIKGDLKYGFARPNEDKSISLHARKISFIHPVKKEKVIIIAPTPRKNALWNEFKNLTK